MITEEIIESRPGVYQITNLLNGKIYIGSSIDIKQRKRQHESELKYNKHHSIYLQRSWIKYGDDSFLFSVLEYIDNKEEILEKEQYYLDMLKPYDPKIGYNSCRNARNCLGVQKSQETRNKLSEALRRRNYLNRGKKISQKVKDKIGASNRGKKRSDESKIRYSKSKTGINNPNYQKPLSEEDKQNLMDNSPFNKSIICIESEVRYHPISQASRELGIPASNISAVCKRKRKRVHGLSFKYENEQSL